MAKEPAPRPPARKRKPTELIVTLDEFASICSVTPETMRKHLATAPADAAWLIERGGRGRGYKIAAAGAVAWYQARSAGGDDVDARSAAIAEMRMQMLGDAGDDEGLGFTGKQRYEEYKAGEAELAYRQAIGELCRISEVVAVTVNAVIELRRGLQGIGPTIRRKFNLDREVETAIEDLITEKLAALKKTLDVDVDLTSVAE